MVGALKQQTLGLKALPMARWHWLLLAGAVALAGTALIYSNSASGQSWGTPGQVLGAGPVLNFPDRPKPDVRRGPATGQMLVQANEIQYDYANERVAAVGNVQIYYNNSTLEADKVTYDQKSKRLHAEGNVRLTEDTGQVTHAVIMDLSDDFRDGFVDSLRVELPDQSRVAAARVERSEGRFSVFQSSVYTACEPCKDNPKKPPLWQVRSARMIHDKSEKMIYFEDATLELYGFPIAYFPYFSMPDPTVKRKSGFLRPNAGYTSRLGIWARIPYFWAIAPDYDLTITPTFMSQQGPHLHLEWRQRLSNGSYTINGSGIWQQDVQAFINRGGAGDPGARSFRGAVDSSGLFTLTDKWAWGWDLIVPTDPLYFRDYRLRAPADPMDLLRSEGVNDIFLTGRGTRSYFDARSIYFYGFSVVDSQDRIPVIHPVIDYSYIFADPVYGGELGYKANLTSLSRNRAGMDPYTQMAISGGLCSPTSADPAARMPAHCLLRGVPGTYTRFSAEVHWRRRFVDGFGQIFIPFASLRADAAMASVRSDPGVANFITTGDTNLVRVMPTAGVEYRYPFISVHSWGTQTIEPIAQIIVRPNETDIGRLPNEDSQSLIFDDSNLFKIDKFAGWDRAEGGGRANVGVQYTAHFNRAGYLNVLFGQSYHLFGTNSFAVGDLINTGLNSGLDTSRSDYVARALYRPNSYLTMISRFRFDQATFATQRFELEGRVSFNRWSLGMVYGSYAAQPALGFLRDRQGVRAIGRFKLTQNWVLNGDALYDIDDGKVISTNVGVGYVDDCLLVALNYLRGYSYSTTTQDTQTVMLQIQLRTLGGVSTSQSLDSVGLR